MPNYNLTSQQIKDTYEQLVQVSASLLVDGTGSLSPIVTSSIIDFPTEVSRSAAAAGFGNTAGLVTEATFTSYTASNDSKVNSLISATSSYALKTDISGAFTSTSASLAANIATNTSDISTLTSQTSSYALKTEISGAFNTSSLLVTASFSNPDLTFTKGDGTTFQQSLVSLVPTSASYALTASFAANATIPTLQEVTNVGNTTTTAITSSGGFLGNLDGNATTATSASFATTTTSASFAETSSFANEFNVATNLKVGSSFSAGGSNPVTFDRSLSFGFNNIIGANDSMIIGAENNTNNAQFCAIVGAAASTISSGDTSTILGGYQHTINGGLRNTIIGGDGVTNGQSFTTTIGKESFTATKQYTVYIDNLESTGSLNHSGSVQVVGSITSSIGFSGDGSGLTNVTAVSASFATTSSHALNVGLVSGGGASSIKSADFLTATASVASNINTIAIGSNTRATDDDAIAIGKNSLASALNSTALGIGALASGVNSVAMGRASATSVNSFAFGDGSVASNSNTVAIGIATQASGDESVSIGTAHNATGDNSVAIGRRGLCNAQGAVSIGSFTQASATNATAIGNTAVASGIDSTALSALSKATGEGSVAIGVNATGSGQNSTAIGVGAEANALNSSAIGASALASGVNSVAMGNATAGGTNAFALGDGANASNTNTTALGVSANAGGGEAVAIGTAFNVSGENALGVGRRGTSSGDSSIAIGSLTEATANNAIAIGASITATSANEINIGNRFKFDGVDSIFLSGSVTSSIGFSGDGSGLTNVSAVFATSASYAAGNFEVSGQIFSPVFSGSIASSTASFDFDNGNFAVITLTAPTHIANPSNIKSGTTYTLIINSGSLVSNYGTVFKFADATQPTLSNGVDIVTMVSDGTSLYTTGLANFQ